MKLSPRTVGIAVGGAAAFSPKQGKARPDKMHPITRILAMLFLFVVLMVGPPSKQEAVGVPASMVFPASLPAGAAQFGAKSATKNEKGPRRKSQALGISGGAERDLPVGLLNAIRNTSPIEPEIPRKDGYPDPESGD